MSTTEREAACACGQLAVRVRGEPQLVGLCHCRQCQRRTGSLFGAAAFFTRAQVVSEQGAARQWTRVGDSGRSLTFHFCEACGSTVYWTRGHRPDLVVFAVGAFAEGGFPPPGRISWTESAHGWLHLPDDIPSHPQSP